MADEVRFPIFKGDGSEDLDQHWFLCEVVVEISIQIKYSCDSPDLTIIRHY
jgi:hypothetical protein